MSSSRIRSPLFPLVLSGWLFAFWLALGISAAQAETGEVHFLPMPPHKPDHGLNLQIDSRWIDGSGYRPVRVTVGTANGLPAPADRRLQVTLQPQQYMFSSELTRVTQEVELPQGAASATTSILVPQQSAWYGISLEVREDGRKLDELSNGHLSTYSSYYGNLMTEAYPATIVFHRNAPVRNQRANWVVDQANRLDSGEEVAEFPDLRILFNEQTMPSSVQLKSQLTGSPYQAVTALQSLPRTDLLPLADVPDTWLGLSSADLLVFELQDLRTLQSTSPEKVTAVRDWVLAGGNLLVWNAGEQGIDNIDQWFGLEQEASQDWTEFSLESANTNDLGLLRTLRHPRSQYGINVSGEYSPLAIKDGKLVETSDRNSGNAPGPEKSLMLASRELGYGKMLLLQEDPFPGNLGTWDHLFGSFGGSRLAWFERHGMSRIRENLGFWDFLVPGVGVAPVTTFEVLITLFVILIGPVNYFFLRAINRLNLLIITVPAGAFIITGLLMVYAVVSDGLNTQTRIRSMTTLDQTTGLGATWSRQAYYSGLASSAGLSFPTDAAVFEYEQFPLTENHSQKRLKWGKTQVLSGGYFRSRVTQQFLTIRPYATERQLKIDTSSNGVTVTNQLGTKILALMLVDESGTPHFGRNLDIDAQGKLRPNDSEAANQIRALVGGGNLGVPDGFDRQMYVRRANQRRYYSSSYSTIPEQYQVEPNFSHALMERKLQGQLMNSFSALGPRSYVAIVERFPETPIGIDVPSGEKSLEVIQATW